jgi:hypothetical protein
LAKFRRTIGALCRAFQIPLFGGGDRRLQKHADRKITPLPQGIEEIIRRIE